MKYVDFQDFVWPLIVTEETFSVEVHIWYNCNYNFILYIEILKHLKNNIWLECLWITCEREKHAFQHCPLYVYSPNILNIDNDKIYDIHVDIYSEFIIIC